MKKRILGLVFGAAMVAGFGGCNANLSSFQVLGIVPPDDMCAFSAATTVFQSDVVIDLNVARRARVALLGRNTMVATLNEAAHVTELRTIMVEGARVRFRTENFVKLAERYAFTFATVAPSQGSAPIPFELLTSRDIDVLRGDTRIQNVIGQGQGTVTIVANVQLDGRMTEGGRIQASEVAIPIRLCKGCLSGPQPPVPMGKTLEQVCREATVVSPCLAGQDAIVDFCLYDQLRR